MHLEVPAMERYRGICFVDTPGLDSVFEHNTDASMEWLPNTGLALVAVGVDPPLSAHDVELIRNLSRFTPNISVLLTKVDTLAADERGQVERFVHEQLARYWNGSVPVFSYSIRPGFEYLREQLDQQLLSRARTGAGEQHAAILRHKTESLLAECGGYLNVALKAAESADSEREQLRERIVGQKESLDDTRLTLRLVARHAAAGARTTFEEILRRDEEAVRAAAPRWPGAGVPRMDPQPERGDGALRRVAARRRDPGDGGALAAASRRVSGAGAARQPPTVPVSAGLSEPAGEARPWRPWACLCKPRR